MPKWYDLALKEVGTKEVPGTGDNPKVVQYYADAGFAGIKHDSVAWCAAFSNAMLERAGVKGSNSLLARSYLNWGEELKRPVKGCIVVFKRGSSTWQGHVGFFVRETASYVYVLGGNQSNAVNISRFSKANLLGYRWPKGVELPKADPITRVLRRGSRGVDVARMQEALGFKGADVDGDFGPMTQSAVRAYQKKNSLEIDGIAGPQTLGHMGLA